MSSPEGTCRCDDERVDDSPPPVCDTHGAAEQCVDCRDWFSEGGLIAGLCADCEPDVSLKGTPWPVGQPRDSMPIEPFPMRESVLRAWLCEDVLIPYANVSPNSQWYGAAREVTRWIADGFGSVDDAVATYRRHGKVLPEGGCEVCGVGYLDHPPIRENSRCDV